MKDCKTTEREAIEWISIRWHDEAETAGLPRVLLIGDSIVAAHATLLRDKLKGRFGVDYFATSKIVSDHEFMPDLLFMLGRYKYDMIIFNNGLHGSVIADETYGKALFATLSVLKQYTPQLVWRNSTPCYPGPDKKKNPWTARVRKRNSVASMEVAKLDIPTINCYGILAGKPELVCDGVHFNQKGYNIMVDIEADFIGKYFAKAGRESEAPRGKPRGIFAEFRRSPGRARAGRPAFSASGGFGEVRPAIHPRGKPRGIPWPTRVVSGRLAKANKKSKPNPDVSSRL